MAKFSFRCECFKSGEIGGLDKHNRRLNENYISNPDIKTELSEDNRIYIAPKQSLYKDCKEQIEKRVIAHGGRITKASNWLCECVFSYPDELPLERLDEYNDLIIRYMNSRFDNMVVSAICHLDEGGLPHLHLDILPITEDNRLSAKTLITRDFITSMHKVMPIILRKHGFNIDEYEETEEKKKGGLSAKEYKKKMEEEKKALDKKLDKMADEYNKLVDNYNHLLLEAKALEERNIRKAKELLEERERTR
jgi:hypothetical protein